ncbi:MAG: hypothetical protein ACLR7D_03955 [Lachnospira eligens]
MLVLGVSVYSLTISYTDIDGTTRTGLQGMGAYVIPNMKGITVKQFCTVLMDAMTAFLQFKCCYGYYDCIWFICK